MDTIIPLFQWDWMWFVVRDDPHGVPTNDCIQQHGPDELGFDPAPSDIRVVKEKAMSIFTRTVDDTLLNRFIHVNSPTILWTSLRDAYAGNTVTQKMMLRQQIFNLRFPEG